MMAANSMSRTDETRADAGETMTPIPVADLLREAQDRFHEMVDALPTAIYTTDAQGCLTYFNPAAVRLSGRTPELGTDQWCVTWKIFLSDGTPLPHDQCPMATALKGGVVNAGGEYIAERPDGSRFWFSPYPSALRDREGRITGGINMLVDVTERKGATEELFRTIVDTTPEWVKIVSADGTLLHMNSAGLEMVGANNPEEVIGKSLYHLIAPEFQEAFRLFNERICRGEAGSLVFDMIGLHGHRRHMETSAKPLRWSDGKTVQLAITRDITERSTKERAALLLSAIVDSSDDAIISKDLNGIITSWNKSAERLFGYTAAEAVGNSIADLLIPADRQDEEPSILERLRRGERVDHFETIRRRKDGTLLDISLTISPVKDANGRIIGASKIARDISDRKRTDKAIEALTAQLSADLTAMTRMQQLSTRLLQTDEFPELLGEILDAAIEITRADMGSVQLMEGDAPRIVSQRGFDPAQLRYKDGSPENDKIFGRTLECSKRMIIEDIATSPVFRGTEAHNIMLAAGARALQCTPLISRSGRLLGMFSTHYRVAGLPSDRQLRLLDILARQAADLIERKSNETAFLASEWRFRQLADAMPQIVWTARPDGYVDYYNERWYEFTGFTRDKFGDASWEPVLHPDDVRLCYETWYGAVESGQPYRIEYRFWDRSENRWRWFMGRALPVRDRGKIVKWFGTCTDIDEHKRVEDDLRRANSDLEQFAYSASHDLQEPLRSIKIYGELLTSRYGSKLDGQALEFLDFLRTGASRMEMLVRDLLAYTQVTRLNAPGEATDANEALATTLANVQGAIVESGTTVTFDPLPPVRLHSTHLRQLFQNLIGNAIKYRSPERAAAVHVSAEQQSGFWVFTVSDNGIGIPPEYREHIFGLFKRLHSGDEYSGTGIGLAICQRIVERYHGRIWVESEPGRGSRFRFALPV
jgi:PAS domain S-box-containing protein